MAAERDSGVVSDTEGGEKPVREQLQKAHIAPQSSGEDASTIITAHAHQGNGEKGELELTQPRKSEDEMRDDSHDDAANPASSRHHTRKRSRDSTFEEDETNRQRKISGERARDAAMTTVTTADEDTKANGASGAAPAAERPATPEIVGEKRAESELEALTSPKIKRTRLQGTEAPSQPEADTAKTMDTTTTEPVVKDSSTTKIPASSAFTNASAVSPFGALSGASSGFGAIGKTSGSFGRDGAFGTASSTATEKSTPASGSTFGSSLGQKSTFGGGTSSSTGGFGSNVSGFGTLGSSSSSGFGGGLGGSGFGSLASVGGGLTSFASGKPSAPFKASKPLDAPVADEEEDGDDGDDDGDGNGVRSPLTATDEDKQDERFYQQDLETGEEDEQTQYSCRAKLYNFVTLPEGKKEWRERGLGVLRLNVKRTEEEDAGPADTIATAAAASSAPPLARFLMRAEGSHRVVLNTPIKKEIKFGDTAGGAPQGGYMYFMGAIDGASKLELLQLKMRHQIALELHEKITELQAEM